MTTLSLQAKKAYFAKSRKSNYVASMRLEGFSVSKSDVDRKLSTREAVIKSCLSASKG
mgnify:CR=1 FL=1|jgi:hypothetical protein